MKKSSSQSSNQFNMDKVTTKRLSLFTGRTHPELAAEVSEHLGIRLGDANIVEFSNVKFARVMPTVFAVVTFL